MGFTSFYKVAYWAFTSVFQGPFFANVGVRAPLRAWFVLRLHIVVEATHCIFGVRVYMTVQLTGYGSFRKLGAPYSGVLIIRILLFRVLY